MKIKRNIERSCLTCGEKFLASQAEANRGNAKYCSLSCATTGNNNARLLHQKSLELTCKNCGRSFSTKVSHQKFCCFKCKNAHAYRKRQQAVSRKKEFSELREKPCEVCGWKDATRDMHHIVPVRKGGKDAVDNLVILCPNHHRLAHQNLLSQDDLKKIVNARTISSSPSEGESGAMGSP